LQSSGNKGADNLACTHDERQASNSVAHPQEAAANDASLARVCHDAQKEKAEHNLLIARFQVKAYNSGPAYSRASFISAWSQSTRLS